MYSRLAALVVAVFGWRWLSRCEPPDPETPQLDDRTREARLVLLLDHPPWP